MATEQQIQEWKAQYVSVNKIKLAGKDYYFRPLTRTEYVSAITDQAQDPNFDYEMAVTKICTLGDVAADLEAKSGIATVLCENILSASGFQQVEVEEV